jgi:hypothetical protein
LRSVIWKAFQAEREKNERIRNEEKLKRQEMKKADEIWRTDKLVRKEIR